jgi:secreted Zn-dependent insulinase-like peptidase
MRRFAAKAEHYVATLLGHEGKGSVLAALKADGLATSLNAGIDEDEHTSAAATFGVQVRLVFTHKHKHTHTPAPSSK